MSGQSYPVRYKVKNIYGWSTNYSPVLNILAATVPAAPTNVVTTNSLIDNTVRISWTTPSNTGGNSVTITAYQVLI